MLYKQIWVDFVWYFLKLRLIKKDVVDISLYRGFNSRLDLSVYRQKNCLWYDFKRLHRMALYDDPFVGFIFLSFIFKALLNDKNILTDLFIYFITHHQRLCKKFLLRPTDHKNRTTNTNNIIIIYIFVMLNVKLLKMMVVVSFCRYYINHVLCAC